MSATSADSAAGAVRLHIIRHAIDTGRVLQPAEIADAMGRSRDDVERNVLDLAAGRALILAPNSTNIWAAPPFCAVPSGFRVEIGGITYWGMCAWDALGVVATVHADTATIRAPCGDCGEILTVQISAGDVARSDILIHFALPARQWWDNIGFT